MRPLLFILLILFACHASKKHGKSQPEKKMNAVINDTDYIVFLTLNINKDSILKKNKIQIISLKRQAGKLKNELQTSGEFTDYLILEIYEKDRLIKTTELEHPLYRHMEYIDENRQFATKDMALSRADFFVRFHMKGTEGKVRISEKVGDIPLTELSVIQL